MRVWHNKLNKVPRLGSLPHFKHEVDDQVMQNGRVQNRVNLFCTTCCFHCQKPMLR